MYVVLMDFVKMVIGVLGVCIIFFFFQAEEGIRVKRM